VRFPPGQDSGKTARGGGGGLRTTSPTASATVPHTHRHCTLQVTHDRMSIKFQAHTVVGIVRESQAVNSGGLLAKSRPRSKQTFRVKNSAHQSTPTSPLPTAPCTSPMQPPTFYTILTLTILGKGRGQQHERAPSYRGCHAFDAWVPAFRITPAQRLPPSHLHAPSHCSMGTAPPCNSKHGHPTCSECASARPFAVQGRDRLDGHQCPSRG
jgi:hypothetical protein